MMKRNLKRRNRNPHKKVIKTSKLEKRFEMLLKELNIKYSTQKQLGWKYYDFFLPEHKILIEVDGDY
jgi:very-short-patch-repair endonuclease